MLIHRANCAVYLGMMAVLTAADTTSPGGLAVIGGDTVIYALLGLVGAFIGSLVRIVQRDEADVEDKIKFFYLKDVVVITAWSLVGGFFPLAFAANGWYPGFAVPLSPFMPKVWDAMDKAVPGIITSFLAKFTSGSGGAGNDNSKKETTSSNNSDGNGSNKQ